MTKYALSELDWLRNRVRVKRFDKRLSYRAAAKQIGSVTGQALSNFEKGQAGLKAATMLALLRWLEADTPLGAVTPRSSHHLAPGSSLQAILDLVYNDASLDPSDALVIAEVIEQLYRSLRHRNGDFS